MMIIETNFKLKTKIEIKKLGITFRKLKKSEKNQILQDLKEKYFNNPYLESAKENDLNLDAYDIEKTIFWTKLDNLDRQICMFNNLLTEDRFKILGYDEVKIRLEKMIVIEYDKSVICEYVDSNRINKFISNLLSLYGIYASPLEMKEKVRFDYTYILDNNLLDKDNEKYFIDLILNYATLYNVEGNDERALKFVNISQKYLIDLKKLISKFKKNEIRAFVSSIDLIFMQCSTIENRIINLTSAIEKLLISSEENICRDFILKAGIIIKKYLKHQNNDSNIAIKSLLAFSYNIRSCIVHGNDEKIITYLDNLTKKDKEMIKLYTVENINYMNKITNAYIIAEQMLYLSLRAIIKYWFDYPSELNYLKIA